MADMIMHGVSTGTVVFPDGKTINLSPKDWLDLVWKVYGQIDGPPRDYSIDSDVVLKGPGVLLPPIEEESTEDE